MNFSRILLVSLFTLLLTTQVYGQKKRAQTSMKFLSVSPAPRAAAMSNAVTSVNMGAYGAFYNPATLSLIKDDYSAAAGAVQWITDINHNNISLAFKPADGRFGVFGINAISVDYGDILSTVVDENDPKGFRDVGTINPTAMAVGIAYANQITEQFSVGANFRFAMQDLGSVATSTNEAGDYNMKSYSASTGLVDFGVLYKTGFKSLNFAMALRNFSPEVQYDEENSELPLTFKIGISMDVFDLTNIDENHSMLVSVDANRPRDFDEQLLFGGEYIYMDRFILRGGFGFPKEEEKYSFGAGIKQPLGSMTLAIDYAYTQFGVFGEVNRFSVQLGF